MHIFYTPYIVLPEFTLDDQESKHAVKVLRLREGDKVQLIDGKGGLYLAEIAEARTKHCRLHVLETTENYHKRNFHLHLAVAPTKNMDRFEFFVEKATEMGIDEITPLLCEHSERKVIKNDRLVKVAIAAAKQSVKPSLPHINELTDLKKFLQTGHKGMLYIAHCIENDQRNLLKNVYNKGEDAVILIGPEGDFSPEEIELAIKGKFIPVSLGNERLRTETAALAACHTINFMNL